MKFAGHGSDSYTDKYVYCYQIFNNPSSTVVVDYFSVGLYPGAAVFDALSDPGSISGVPGGKILFNPFILSGTVLYLFFTPDYIAAGQYSSVLLFTSDTEPTLGSGVVSGGYTGGVVVSLPTPIPEPAAFSLFALIAPALLKYHRPGLAFGESRGGRRR